jgi:hypothetical protein
MNPPSKAEQYLNVLAIAAVVYYLAAFLFLFIEPKLIFVSLCLSPVFFMYFILRFLFEKRGHLSNKPVPQWFLFAFGSSPLVCSILFWGAVAYAHVFKSF